MRERGCIVRSIFRIQLLRTVCAGLRVSEYVEKRFGYDSKTTQIQPRCFFAPTCSACLASCTPRSSVILSTTAGSLHNHRPTHKTSIRPITGERNMYFSRKYSVRDGQQESVPEHDNFATCLEPSTTSQP